VLKLEIQHLPQTAVVRCLGRIVRGDATDDLLRAVMSQDSPHIQIDLSRTNAIDAGGLGALVRLERWGRDCNRVIQLTNPTARIRKVLDATGLTAVFQIEPAVQSRGNAA
jgi:anti-anti-sigma factor